MGTHNDLPAGSFAANLGLRAMFLATFAGVCSRAFNDLQTPLESYTDADDYRTDLAQALETTMMELGLEGTPGMREYSWVDQAFPVLALASEKFCSDPPPERPHSTPEAILAEESLRNAGSLLRFYFAALRGMRNGEEKKLDAANFARLIADVRAGAEAHGMTFSEVLSLADSWTAVQAVDEVPAELVASLTALDADTRPPAACNVVVELESLASVMENADLVKESGRLLEVRDVAIDLIEQQKRDATLVSVLSVYLNENLTDSESVRLATDLQSRGLHDHALRRRDVLMRSGAAG